MVWYPQRKWLLSNGIDITDYPEEIEFQRIYQSTGFGDEMKEFYAKTPPKESPKEASKPSIFDSVKRLSRRTRVKFQIQGKSDFEAIEEESEPDND